MAFFSLAARVLAISSLSFGSANFSISEADGSFINNLNAQNSSTSQASICACNALSSLFPENVFFPGSADYTYEAKAHFYDSRADLSPTCVFVPNTANDVAKGIHTLESCQSIFAVRGGGHMPVAGAANTNDGVLIGLSSFTAIKIAADLKSVEAGPALNWYDLNSALDPYGLVVIGGRLKTIGIAGLTIGGGIHYFTAKYGFAMDNVIEYEIVTAKGEIVYASSVSNPDLFWAMKGGGSNFGIVTKFKFATYKIPQVSTTIQMFDEDAVPAYISAVTDLANYQEDIDTTAGGIFTISYAPSAGVAGPMFLGVQAGSTIQPPVFQNFTSIPSLYSSYNVTTLAQWTSTLDSPYQVTRNIYGMRAVLADDATLQEMYKIFKAGTEPMANVEGLTAYLVFQPIPKSATTVAKTNGIGNTWGVDNSKAYVYWLISTQWANEADDKSVMDWSDDLREKIHAVNMKAGKGLDFMYMNDCSDAQKPFTGFPKENLERLKTIREKYDPSLVFRNLNKGGYKLD